MNKRTVKLPVEMVAIPPVAWPTVVLWLAASVGWTACVLAGVTGVVSAGWLVPLQVALTYALFTPMHDAAHSSVSGSHRWLNQLVGRCCALAFAAPFPAFRVVHLAHHARTNDPVEDPDYWSEGGPAWQKPFRWASQEFYYYYWYLCRAQTRPLAERCEVFSTVLLIYAAVGLLAANGYAREVGLFYLLPIRGALPVLALLFDWLPHHRWPKLVSGLENRYKATHKLKPFLGMQLDWVSLQQSMHCIHHLWPTIPFYRYHVVWKHAQRDLKEAGVETWGIFPEGSRYW